MVKFLPDASISIVCLYPRSLMQKHDSAIRTLTFAMAAERGPSDAATLHPESETSNAGAMQGTVGYVAKEICDGSVSAESSVRMSQLLVR